MGQLVGADHQQHADHALDQADRGRDAPVAADDAVVVDLGVEHLAGLEPTGPCCRMICSKPTERLLPSRRISSRMNSPLSEGRVMCNSRCHAVAPSTAAASYCSWSIRESAARKMIVPQPASFQITWLVTSALNSSGTPMMCRIGQVVLHQEGVEHPGVAEHLLEQRDHDHPGQEVRQVEDRLQEPLEPLAGQAVEQQRQGERHREDQDHLDHRQDQRCSSEGVEELRVAVPQEREVREPRPSRTP